MPRDLFTQKQAVPLAQHEQARRQGGWYFFVRFADQDDIKLEPIRVLNVLQLAVVAKHGAADGIGAPGQPGLITRRQNFFLASREARLPLTEAERGILPWL